MPTWPASRRHRVVSFAICRGPGMTPKPVLSTAGQHCYVVLNAYPYTAGHVMIVPFAHLDELQKLPAEAAHEMIDLGQRMERVLRQLYKPDGINLGMNIGKAAGAGSCRTHPPARAAALGGGCEFHDGGRGDQDAAGEAWRRHMRGSRRRCKAHVARAPSPATAGSEMKAAR